MRFKSSLIALSLSLVCFIPRVALADTITLTTTTGGSVDGVDVYPYLFTVDGVQNVSMSCLNFDREISFNETWEVDPINVSTILAGNTYDNESGASILEDAWLYNQYVNSGTSPSSPYSPSEVQFAIWSIMDPAVINATNNNYNGSGAFDSVAQALANQAIANVTGNNPLPASYYANDTVLLPDPNGSSTWTNGQPQIFMVDPMPTPEPGSLTLLGTGFLGAVFFMRRRLRKA